MLLGDLQKQQVKNRRVIKHQVKKKAGKTN